MSLSNIREGQLKETFNDLKDVFRKAGVDFYVIGAVTKNIWYARGKKTMRQTNDVNFAIQVGSKEVYETIRNYLREKKGFVGVKNNEFVMLTNAGIQIDILPFGAIEIDAGFALAADGLPGARVTGFTEVFHAGTEEMPLQTGHRFKTATLPAIVLLKLLAFDDRPEIRSKDPVDIAGIITHFFELQADLIYEHHVDLFIDENNERTLPQISAIVIGREIKKIANSNVDLIERLKNVLESHIIKKENSDFIRLMVSELGGSVEESIILLMYLLYGLTKEYG